MVLRRWPGQDVTSVHAQLALDRRLNQPLQRGAPTTPSMRQKGRSGLGQPSTVEDANATTSCRAAILWRGGSRCRWKVARSSRTRGAEETDLGESNNEPRHSELRQRHTHTHTFTRRSRMPTRHWTTRRPPLVSWAACCEQQEPMTRMLCGYAAAAAAATHRLKETPLSETNLPGANTMIARYFPLNTTIRFAN